MPDGTKLRVGDFFRGPGGQISPLPRLGEVVAQRRVRVAQPGIARYERPEASDAKQQHVEKTNAVLPLGQARLRPLRSGRAACADCSGCQRGGEPFPGTCAACWPVRQALPDASTGCAFGRQAFPHAAQPVDVPGKRYPTPPQPVNLCGKLCRTPPQPVDLCDKGCARPPQPVGVSEKRSRRLHSLLTSRQTVPLR